MIDKLAIIMKILSVIAVFQAVLITFYLFIQKRGTKVRRYILGAILLTFAVFVTGTTVLLYNHDYYVGHILNLAIFLTAPLLYFYFRSYTSENFHISTRTLVHFLPFTFVFLLMSYEVMILGQKDFVFQPYGIFLASFLTIQNIIYIGIILSRMKNIAENKSDQAKLNWVGFILKSFIALFVLKFIIFIAWNVSNYGCVYTSNIFFGVAFLLVNSLILYSLHKPDLLIGIVRYQSSPINPQHKQNYLAALDRIMYSNELFLDPLVSLDKVARQVKMPGKHLSQLLNEMYGLNFNEYINKYRIEKAKALMSEDAKKEKNLLEIAYEVGFNSKTTFNIAFKKFTGNTPSEFRTRAIN